MKSRFSYRVNNLIFGIGQLVIISTSIFFWVAASSQNDVSIEPKLVYFCVGTFVYGLTSIFSNWKISPDINTGKISQVMIYPCSIWKYYFFSTYATAIAQTVTIFTLLLPFIYFWLPYFQLSTDLFQLLLFFTSMVVGLFIKFFFETITGFIAFFTTENWALMTNMQHLENFISGRLMPLNLIFSLNTIWFIPQAYVYFIPVMIGTGSFDYQTSIFSLFIGLVWMIALFAASKFLFQIGSRRYQSVGL